MYIKNFLLFESKSIYAKSYTLDEFAKSIYGENYRLKDPTFPDRIRFVDLSVDLRGGVGDYDNNFHYIVLYESDKIIGMCKIGNFSYDGDDETMSICYCSIDKNYRGKGYLNILLEELMKLCVEKNFSLTASSWTHPGNQILRPAVKKWAKKYGVQFQDHDRNFDNETLYNDKFIHVSEMTPIEKYEYDINRKKLSEQPTGKYKIYVLKPKYSIDKMNDNLHKMVSGTYKVKKLKGYYYDYGTVYLKTGNDDILAALNYWQTTDDYSYVDKLIRKAGLEYKNMKYKGRYEPSQIQEDVHYDGYKKPEWFYVVLKFDEKTFNSLSEMRFEGLKGISDTINIVESWLDVRAVLVAMPADEVFKLNNIHPIYYFKVDQLVSNNFKILRRMWNKSSGNAILDIKSSVVKICQNASMVLRKDGVLGSKKRARIHGTWKKEPNKNYISDALFYINSPGFYYLFSDYIEKAISVENYKINNMNSFIKLFSSFLKDEEKELRKDRGSHMPKIYELIDIYNKHGHGLFKKLFTWCIMTSSEYYSKTEGEWLVKDDYLTIPKNSKLYIKCIPDDFDTNDEVRTEWINNFNKSYKEVIGKSKLYRNPPRNTFSETKEVIYKYGLNNIYDIYLKNNRIEIYKDLKKLNNL